MKKAWFRWERQASLHLLFPTLEVFFTTLQKYSGVKSPTMILIFEKGVVTWCIKEDEFIEYGNKLLEVYKDPEKEKKMREDINQALGRLKEIEKSQDKLDLKNISNEDLIKVHKDLYQAFVDYYTMGAIGTPLSFSAEILLKQKGLTDEEINRLTTPNEISYISQADDYLLKTKDINGFIKKYFWIDNNYSGTKVLSREDVKKRLNGLKTVVPDSPVIPSKARNLQIKKTKSKDLSLITRDDKNSLRLVELLKNYSIYKDDRKNQILIYLHFLDSILKEVARRTDLSINQVRTSTPYELADILTGKLSQKDLDKRLKYLVVVWEKDADVPLLLTNKAGKKWEQITLSTVVISADAGIQLTGNTACPGKVVGKVRVILKAEDCNQMEDGEILVTFMTSPDFMPAIRKASAIVTNLGGVTSHAAIISRELNIPCIVGTKIATQVLKTGDKVKVDATVGLVRKLG